MLQFIAQQNDRYSIPEIIQMAVEGGCKWVQVCLQGLDEGEVRDTLAEIIPLCRETETILTVENHAELAKDLGIHGVQIIGNLGSVGEVREFCGPEAIIGVNVHQASDLLKLKGLDVDFAAFANLPVERLSENVEAARNADIMLALVAAGNYTIQQIPDIMATGVNGIALGRAIYDAADPVQTTADILTILKDLGNG